MTTEVQQQTIEIPAATAAAELAKQEAEAIRSMSEMFAVTNAEEYTAANEELIAIKAKIREYEKQRVDLKKPILEAGRKVDDLFKPAIAVLTAAETAIKNQMIAWKREQDRIAEEAREKARKELEAAERARVKAIEKGDVTKVAKLEEKVASIAATVAVVPEVPKARGFYVTGVWSANVVDLMALVKAVASGKQPIDLLLPNQAALDDLAKAHTTNLSVPGVLAVKKDSAGSRAR